MFPGSLPRHYVRTALYCVRSQVASPVLPLRPQPATQRSSQRTTINHPMSSLSIPYNELYKTWLWAAHGSVPRAVKAWTSATFAPCAALSAPRMASLPCRPCHGCPRRRLAPKALCEQCRQRSGTTGSRTRIQIAGGSENDLCRQASRGPIVQSLWAHHRSKGQKRMKTACGEANEPSACS